MIRGRKVACTVHISVIPKGRVGRLQGRALSHLCPPYSRPIARSLDSTAECRTPFREPLQFIVIAVMSVMSGAFPDTYGVFYMTVNCGCVWGPSCHRHRGKGLGKRFSRYRDGDDAHDGHLRAYSRQGALLYFVGSLTPSTLPDKPDAQSKEPLTYAIFEATSGVGFV
jgi:hypothetical protein